MAELDDIRKLISSSDFKYAHSNTVPLSPNTFLSATLKYGAAGSSDSDSSVLTKNLKTTMIIGGCAVVLTILSASLCMLYLKKKKLK
jgi:hypothetical protein